MNPYVWKVTGMVYIWFLQANDTHTHTVLVTIPPAAFSAPDPTDPWKGQSAEPRDN